MSGNAAIYFEPEGYSITGPRLMGRNAAGYGFLNGFFRHATVDHFVGVSPDPAKGRVFGDMARSAGVIRPISVTHVNDAELLSNIGCLFIPGPGLCDQAFRRSLIGNSTYSLCGVTHTLLSDRVMDALCATLTAPVEPWDAIICTSTTAQATIKNVLAAESERLTNRLGATRFPNPYLPVIPLGVDCEKYTLTPERRINARKRLGFRDDEIIILFAGRLSFHAKAHPITMYQALAAASKGHAIRLVEYGQFSNEPIRSSFDELWSACAPDIPRTVLDGASFETGDDAWAAADIFCSLSDNFQETFGLTPVEAMAASLPVVVSDWNGYRDTIRHNVDGFRVSTTAPPSGFGKNLIERYARGEDSYDLYCGTTSMTIAVDLNETIEALRILIQNPSLRKTMGQSGRARAQDVYDWCHIVKHYQNLWQELHERRTHSRQDQISPHPWPARLDPFEAFQTYATHQINPHTKFVRRPELAKADIDKILALKSLALAGRLLPNREDFHKIIDQFSPNTAISLNQLERPNVSSQNLVIAYIAIGLKIGALAVSPDHKETSREQ